MRTLNLPDPIHAHLIAYCKRYGLYVGNFAARTLALAMQSPPDFGSMAEDAGKGEDDKEEEPECSECETSLSRA